MPNNSETLSSIIVGGDDKGRGQIGDEHCKL